jgi:hypothetical protein
MFLGSLAGHFIAGYKFESEQLAMHGTPPISLADYVIDPQFLSTVFENWESEFLQMSAYVILTSFLFQRGSSESADPDAPPRDEMIEPPKPGRSAMLQRGPKARWIYAHSLGIVLFILFVATFLLHWLFSAREAAQEAIRHGDVPVGTVAYLADSGLWFESLQNWQSEFLSTAVLVVLSIYLRQRGSPESKPVGAPHQQTGA